MEDRFFVIYPKTGYSETEKIIRDITGRLGIGYQLWSYADVRDEYEYYQTVVEPAIEKAEFVLVFLAKGAEKEYLVSEPVRLCNNMNKSTVPIKLKNSDVKEKNWNFRAKLLDYYDVDQRIRIVEQMHGWLGLVSRGDVYGSKVEISTDSKSVIVRNNEVLGTADRNGIFDCVFAQGSREVDIKSDDGCWNRYKYSVPDNDSELHFEASLSGVRQLSKTNASSFTFDPDGDEIPRWDVTNRTDFLLVASSEDEKKKDIIYNSFDRYYRSKMKPYPEFHPREIVHSKAALIVFWCISATLFIAYGLGVIVIVTFFIVRRIKDNSIRRKNERKRRELKESTDRYNYSVWHEVNERMINEFKFQGLTPIPLKQQSAPSNVKREESVKNIDVDNVSIKELKKDSIAQNHPQICRDNDQLGNCCHTKSISAIEKRDHKSKEELISDVILSLQSPMRTVMGQKRQNNNF